MMWPLDSIYPLGICVMVPSVHLDHLLNLHTTVAFRGEHAHIENDSFDNTLLRAKATSEQRACVSLKNGIEKCRFYCPLRTVINICRLSFFPLFPSITYYHLH